MHDVVIVGLGRIGMGYDLEHDPEKYVLSHARAFHQHSQFRLCAGVDPSAERRRLFELHYARTAYATLSDVFAENRPSVVVIATPTNQHISTINEVLQLGQPQAIVCEKPIAFDVSEAHAVVAACKEKNCAMYVNYMRRSDVGVSELCKRLQCQHIQGPIKGVVWYSKGLFNSASHFVNLLQYFLGDVVEVRVRNRGRLGDGVDPEPDFEIVFAGGEIQFIALHTENFFHNAMELMAVNGRLRYEYGGEHIIWEKIDSNKVFTGYTTLEHEAERLPSDFFRVQWHFVDQLARSLAGQPADICSGVDALSTLDILEQIKGIL